MRTIIFITIIFLTTNLVSQDYSMLGKKINYSEEFRKADKYKDISKALTNPAQVLSLELIVDKDGNNYKRFIYNQSKFVNLRKLIIDNRWYQLDLNAIPDLSVYKNLEFLQIYHLPKLNLEQLTGLTNLKYLGLLSCNLKALPSSIFKLKQLEFIDLTLNYLNIIPDDISQMTNLKEVDLSNNCFEEIPKQLAKVQQLMYLDMNNAEFSKQFNDGTLFCYNKITVYPEILSEFKALKKLHLFKVNIDIKTKDKLKSDFKNIKFIF